MKALQTQKGSSISRQNLNDNLETLHLAPTLFYHLPGFYLKPGFLNLYPFSLLQTFICYFSLFSMVKNIQSNNSSALKMS